MSNLNSLFEKHAAVIVFDCETSGLDADKHQIIELAAIRIERTSTAGLQAEQDAIKSKIEALGPVPARPEFLSGYWNGKIYSGKSGYRIYLDGKEQDITAAQYVEIIAYERGSKAYADAVAAIRSGK